MPALGGVLDVQPGGRLSSPLGNSVTYQISFDKKKKFFFSFNQSIKICHFQLKIPDNYITMNKNLYIETD